MIFKALDGFYNIGTEKSLSIDEQLENKYSQTEKL